MKIKLKNRKKDKLIEEAKWKKYAEGFKKLARDPEVKKIAEEGIDDYFSLLRNHNP